MVHPAAPVMFPVGVYAEHPRSETRHIVVDPMWPAIASPSVRTLCGRSVDGFTPGDETASGVSATCLVCRVEFRRLARKEVP